MASRAASWIRMLDEADHLIFREPDLDAVARGWEVRREALFRRTYRDPRWDTPAPAPASILTS